MLLCALHALEFVVKVLGKHPLSYHLLALLPLSFVLWVEASEVAKNQVRCCSALTLWFNACKEWNMKTISAISQLCQDSYTDAFPLVLSPQPNSNKGTARPQSLQSKDKVSEHWGQPLSLGHDSQQTAYQLPCGHCMLSGTTSAHARCKPACNANPRRQRLEVLQEPGCCYARMLHESDRNCMKGGLQCARLQSRAGYRHTARTHGWRGGQAMHCSGSNLSKLLYMCRATAVEKAGICFDFRVCLFITVQLTCTTFCRLESSTQITCFTLSPRSYASGSTFSLTWSVTKQKWWI